jgi:hypothetical protein
MATSGTSKGLSLNEDGIKVVCSRWAKDHRYSRDPNDPGISYGGYKTGVGGGGPAEHLAKKRPTEERRYGHLCAHLRYRARLPFLGIERLDFYLGQIRARSAQVAIVVVRYWARGAGDRVIIFHRRVKVSVRLVGTWTRAG